MEIKRLYADQLTFTRRDPEKIGNGLHDYDIHHKTVEDGEIKPTEFIGTIYFDTSLTTTGSRNNAVIVSLDAVKGTRYRLPITMDQCQKMASNEKIFNEIRPMIVIAYRTALDQ